MLPEKDNSFIKSLHPACKFEEELDARDWDTVDFAQGDGFVQLSAELLLSCTDQQWDNRDDIRLGEFAAVIASRFGHTEEHWLKIERDYLQRIGKAY